MIRLLVGLGNPTPQYEKTRHNAGFWFLDRVAEQSGSPFRVESRFHGMVAKQEARSLVLLKPMTYMNRSGLSVGAIKTYYRLEAQEILVAHDDLDLAPGVVRIKKGGGHGGHNGLRDLLSHLGSPDFFRLRIGIGHPGRKEEVANYVLGTPTRTELEAIQGALDLALQGFAEWVSAGPERAMNLVNSRS